MARDARMSSWRMLIAMAALFVSSMCTMGDLVITSIAADLYVAFADAPEALINFGITGPALVGLPFSLLAGWLCDRFDKKWIMVAGFAIFTFSAIFGAAIENIWYFVITRCLATGMGWGITNTAAFSILADLFSDEKQHGRMVGFYNAAMSIMGAVLSSVAGVLASYGIWQNAFSIYWIAAPTLVLLIVFLPSMKPKLMRGADGHVETTEEIKAEDKGWWKSILPLNAQVLLVAVCYFVQLYMISLFVADTGLGDESFSGLLASCMTMASCLGSLAFGPLFAKMRNAVYFPFLIIIGLCFIVMGCFVGQTTAVFCSLLFGFSWAFYFCYFYVRAADLVPENRKGASTGVIAFSVGLAAFLCSYLITGLMNVTHLGCAALWPCFGAVVIIVCAVSMLYFFTKRSRRSC